MKKLTLLLLTVLYGCSPEPVATVITQPNRVLYRSNDINQSNGVDSIVRIRPGGSWLARNVKLTLRNGERKTIPKKAIWGYSDAKGIVWRRFRNTYYQVLKIGDLVEYEIIESRPIGNGGVINEPVRKYSKTLDSKIVGSRKRALRISEELKIE